MHVLWIRTEKEIEGLEDLRQCAQREDGICTRGPHDVWYVQARIGP
ncbi:hypothetical protein MIDIC_50059 [Alphaproteobacteria bacterium]